MAAWLKQCRIELSQCNPTGVYGGRVLRHSEPRFWKCTLVNARVHEESDRRGRRATCRESVADEAAHIWTVAKFVPASQEMRVMRPTGRQRNDLVQSCGAGIFDGSRGADAAESAVPMC